MNIQDQNYMGRHIWNLCVSGFPDNLRDENGIVVDVLEGGTGAVLDMERFVILLRAEEPVFNTGFPLRSEVHIEAEVFPRETARLRAKKRQRATVPLSAEALWTWREVWDRVCGLTDAARDRRAFLRFLDGDVPGKTVLVTCGELVWRLTSPNPLAFRRDPKREGAWLPLPADAPIDGTMTV
jgi:hypothetical protein